MKFRKIISVALVCAFTAGVLPTLRASAVESWRDAYKEILNEYMESDSYFESARFSLYDMSYDGIPELIISEDTSHSASCLVYTYDNTLIDLGKMGAYGTIGYYSDLDVIIEYNLGQGYEFMAFSRLKNSSLTALDNFSNNVGAAADESELYFKVNKINVSQEEYDNALAEYDSKNRINLGRDYEFTESDINTAFQKNWRELYREKLVGITESEAFSSKNTFDLYDLNSDGVPELIIRQEFDNAAYASKYGNGYGSLAEIYTVSRGELVNVLTLNDESGYLWLNYHPDTGQLIVNDNFDEIRLMTLKRTKFTLDDEFISVGDAEYELNGEPVDYDVFSDMVYGAPYVSIGDKYNFSSAVIDYALAPQKELNSEQKRLILEKLCRLRAEISEYDIINDAQFELCDLNGDGVSELTFSPSISYAAGACTIWTLHGGELAELGYAGVYGNFAYNAESSLVYTYHGRMGMTYGNYFSIEDGTRQTEITFSTNEDYVTGRNEYASETGEEPLIAEYTVNDKSVTMEEYYSLTERYTNEESSMRCGRRYPLTNASIAQAVFGEDSLIPQIKTATTIAIMLPCVLGQTELT